MKVIAVLSLFSLILTVSPSFAAGPRNGGRNLGDDTGNNTPAGTRRGNGGTTGDVTNNGDFTGTNGQSRVSDAAFLRQSVHMALMEIMMGELALSNSQNAAVQEFAQHLIQDHTAQLEQAQTLAGAAGRTLPDTLSARDRASFNRLSGLSGEAFDRAWTQLMVSSHTTALALHQRAAQGARQESVRAYARAQLAPLATHLAQALELWEQYRANNTGPGTRGRGR